jgi:hypothetical protein
LMCSVVLNDLAGEPDLHDMLHKPCACSSEYLQQPQSHTGSKTSVMDLLIPDVLCYQREPAACTWLCMLHKPCAGSCNTTASR